MGDYVRHGMHADCAVERRRVRRQWFEILLFAGLLIMVYGILKLVGWL
jgi:hypothetical protein